MQRSLRGAGCPRGDQAAWPRPSPCRLRSAAQGALAKAPAPPPAPPVCRWRRRRSSACVASLGVGGAASPAEHAPSSVAGVSPKGGWENRAGRRVGKAELFLVRTDGFTCTRESVQDSQLLFNHPSTQQQMLIWKTRPTSVLVLKKLGDGLLPELMSAVRLLKDVHGLRVVVEREVYDRLSIEDGFGFVETFYPIDAQDGQLAAGVDFCVCLGGDGVILHASSLFCGPAPPIISFNLGSLGFLTSHRFEDFASEIEGLLHGDCLTPCGGPVGAGERGAYITLRMRLRCQLLRRGVPEQVYEVLNEVVVNRGNNPYLTKIECYERDRLITRVQADGIILSTPTGSTAYSVSAGGSMVHPCVPAMLFTPVCPHSLSFRPVLLPDSADITLRIPNDARDSAWVSFDGKQRHELRRGDAVRVCMSQHPLPTVNKFDQTNDWFASLGRCLRWNDRVEQGPLDELAHSVSP